MSYNRAPVAKLAPWIARLYASVVEAPADYHLSCGLLNDTSFLRIQLVGEWSAQTAQGPLQYGRAALFFGPQSRRMPVSVTGSFTSIGVSLRPGACRALKMINVRDHVDTIVPTDKIGLDSAAMLARFDQDAAPEEWLQMLESCVAGLAEKVKWAEPDPVSARFEVISFTNPSIRISDFAEECGIEIRKLERIIRRDFGLPPKQVLRRARALDMASHLRGVADQAEAEEIALRFYDQSHLIREFIDLFGMPPSQFVATPQPLMTLTLESRQARRLEMIERLGPDEARPWQ